MTIHATFNPIGSTSPKDLIDNAQNLDYLILGPALLYPDRRSVNRLSWAGIEASFAAAQAQRDLEFDASQVDKETRFDSFIQSWGYDYLGGYDVDGPLTITEYNQVFAKDGGFWKATAPLQLPYTTTGNWVAESGFFVFAGDAVIRQDLASDAGAELVKLDGRSVADTIRDTLNIMDGRFGAIGDRTYHPLSERYSTLNAARIKYPFVTSLAQSIDWAAWNKAALTGRVFYAPTAGYVLTDLVTFKSGGFRGDGYGPWTPGIAELCETGIGTEIMFYGTGAKTIECDHVGADGGTYGRMANPDAAAPYTAFGSVDEYALSDFTNEDAVGAQRATLRKVSVGFDIPPGAQVTMEGFRVVPYFRGQAGYLDMSETGMGADWDFGILNRSSYATLTNFQAVGYWRMAGLGKVATPVTTEVVQAESDHLSRCILQGYRSYLVRTLDQYVVRSSSDALRKVRVDWSASHRWTQSGSFRLAGTDRTYTGLNYVEEDGKKYLEFTGVSGPLGSYTDIFTLRAVSSHFGTSGTVVFDVTVGGLCHHSRLPATSNLLTPRFERPSAAVEISGGPLRAIQFIVCTVVGCEDILAQVNFATEIQWIGCYFEGQGAFTALNDYSSQIGRGGRIISTRGTVNMDFIACTYHSPSVDRRPTLNPGALSETRFSVSGTGLFNPRSYRDDGEFFGTVNSAGDQKTRNLSGNYEIEAGKNVRITPGPGSALLLGPSDGGLARIQALGATMHLGCEIRAVIGNTAGSLAWFTFDSSRMTAKSGTEIGGSTSLFAKSYVSRRYWNATTWDGVTANSSPEGIETGGIGSTCRSLITGRTWEKTSGSGNTGWVVTA